MGSDDDELAQESEIHRRRYEAGDKAALLLLIRHCFMQHWPVPEWAANAFVDACFHVEMGGARSWDEVFGKPHLGRHKRSVALESRKGEVYRRVCVLHDEGSGLPIGEALFERVGEELGREMNPDGKPISKTVRPLTS